MDEEYNNLEWIWRNPDYTESAIIFIQKHLKVNHSKQFVNPITGAHTLQILRTWNMLKRRNKKECRTKKYYSVLCRI